STSASTASGDPVGASASAHPAAPVGSDTIAAEPTGSGQAETEKSGAARAESAPTGTAPTGVDALELTGPVDVADVGDMKPVISGASPRLPSTAVDCQGTSTTVTRAH